MEEIDLKELFDFVKEKLLLLIVIVIATCLVGSIYGLVLQTPMYSSYTTVILSGSDSNNNNGTITQNDITLNKNLVDTYAEIVKSRRVLSQVISELDLERSYEQLASEISVSSVNNTEIIKITVNDDNAVLAKNIANVTANYFINEVKGLYNIDNVNVLDEAIESNDPYNINVVKQVVIYIIIGFVLGAGILFMIFYFDRSIKTVEQIETKIKLPILGSIEEFTRSGK